MRWFFATGLVFTLAPAALAAPKVPTSLLQNVPSEVLRNLQHHDHEVKAAAEELRTAEQRKLEADRAVSIASAKYKQAKAKLKSEKMAYKAAKAGDQQMQMATASSAMAEAKQQQADTKLAYKQSKLGLQFAAAEVKVGKANHQLEQAQLVEVQALAIGDTEAPIDISKYQSARTKAEIKLDKAVAKRDNIAFKMDEPPEFMEITSRKPLLLPKESQPTELPPEPVGLPPEAALPPKAAAPAAAAAGSAAAQGAAAAKSTDRATQTAEQQAQQAKQAAEAVKKPALP